LVHDDLPCMDNDVLRRGKPTVHVEYDEATALLVGDALQSLAFQLLADHRLADDARTQLEMVKMLAIAAGSRGMAGGQQIDLESTGKSAGKDSRQGKPTYVSALGVARARELADELRAESLAALEGFGARARRLAQLADFIVLRKF